ncbi:hypothetical protein LPU83_pLPU83b_0150 (plasmid) [Rhizobium favelukesii]|uniref:Uncharacterized protein n=1 Tax=Rhizobium favelukesii TaxID=348824 RepID=W6S0Z1_9HYPH|nr:hypothetical protein LPU83_pLPU83b_0150 [Rhizobium favelukesii]
MLPAILGEIDTSCLIKTRGRTYLRSTSIPGSILTWGANSTCSTRSKNRRSRSGRATTSIIISPTSHETNQSPYVYGELNFGDVRQDYWGYICACASIGCIGPW